MKINNIKAWCEYIDVDTDNVLRRNKLFRLKTRYMKHMYNKVKIMANENKNIHDVISYLNKKIEMYECEDFSIINEIKINVLLTCKIALIEKDNSNE